MTYTRFTADINTTKEVRESAKSSNGPSLWQRIGKMEVGTYRFRLLPPLDSQRKAWGNSTYVPLISWGFNVIDAQAKGGKKFFNSISERSLSRDGIDTVEEWLRNTVKLETMQGFRDKGNETCAPQVLAFRNLVKSSFDKYNFKPISPNSTGQMCMTVIAIDQDPSMCPYIDPADGKKYSVPVRGAEPVFLVMRDADVKSFESGIAAKQKFKRVFWPENDGVDVILTLTEDVVGTNKTIKSSWDFPDEEHYTELYDWQGILETCPDLMATLQEGCNPAETMEHIAKALQLYDAVPSSRPASQAAPVAPPARRQPLNTAEAPPVAPPAQQQAATQQPQGGIIQHPPLRRTPVNTAPPAAQPDDSDEV